MRDMTVAVRMVFIAGVIAVITAGLWAAEGKSKKNDKGKAKSNAKGKHPVIVLETTKGAVEIMLFPEDAPKHCANFEKLVSEKFYDGIVFHRVIPSFMAQTGDPLTKEDPDHPQAGTGGAKDKDGSQYTIPAEIKRKHRRGSVAAARTNNPEKRSSSSQFYICFDTAGVAHLDDPVRGGYTVFGEVTKGMDVVDKIVKGDKIKKATIKK